VNDFMDTRLDILDENELDYYISEMKKRKKKKTGGSKNANDLD
jgi:hypothetical protein